jgi:arylsulfatase
MLQWRFSQFISRKITFTSLLLIAGLLLSVEATAMADKAQQQKPVQLKRPNILLIVADDLGYSDLGVYGGEINTPNLDKLASDGGVTFTDFHAAPTCSPTRSMIMSGTYNHRAGLGAMAEWTADNQRNQPGYEGYLNRSVVALPTLMRDAGYHTFMAGKWHLGMATDQGPDVRGFEQSFTMLPGAGGHYSDRGLNPQLPKIPYRENGKPVQLPDNFYSTEYYTDKVIEYIDRVQSSDQPFFGYVAYTAPHWPLQVPAQYSDKYSGRYAKGYADIKQSRLHNMRKAGIISDQLVANPGSGCYAEWDQLSAEERQNQARLMEVYAGMVDALDDNIGRLIEHLKSIGEYQNTLIMFISDNGADARPDEGLGFETSFVEKNFDNSYANIGAENSFNSYGGAWAEVGSAPFRLHKGDVTEGGIRVPAIVHFAGGKLEPGIRREFASVMDIMPTFLELAGAEHPGEQYQGRKALPVAGKSMLSYLEGAAKQVHEKPLYGFSIHMAQGLQSGPWKIVKLPPPKGDDRWQLYNLDQDPGETQDLASSQPERLSDMILQWQSFASETGIIVSQPGSRSPKECQKH